MYNATAKYTATVSECSVTCLIDSSISGRNILSGINGTKQSDLFQYFRNGNKLSAFTPKAFNRISGVQSRAALNCHRADVYLISQIVLWRSGSQTFNPKRLLLANTISN